MKPLKEIIFMPIQGIWSDVAGDSGTLSETLERLEIIVDDKCEFARFKDYQNNIAIWYRAEAMRVKISLWRLK